MSGGMNSSVVAAILKKQGYDVVGITLQLFDYGKIGKSKVHVALAKTFMMQKEFVIN